MASESQNTTDSEKPIDDAPETEENPVSAAGQPDGKADGTVRRPRFKKAKGEFIQSDQPKKPNKALRFIMMTAGSLMMSLSVYLFQTPNNFTIGGVGGLSIVISNQTKQFGLTQSYVMIIINVLLLILGFILIGRKEMFRTIWCTVLYTFVIWIMEFFDVVKLISGGTTLTDDPFLELVYAVLLMGVGGALIFNCGSSSGGTDIIALILKKYTKINVGMALLLADLAVAIASFFVFASMENNVEIALFSLLGLFTKSFLLDGVIENLAKTKYITIITKNPEAIAPYILKVIKHGLTVYDAEGGYTGEKKKVLITICKRSEAIKLKIKVKQVDPAAFVIITDANEILGKGFGGTM